MQLVLSLFPGIGLLDRAFEEAGFCVVRGPDTLWGGDIRNFHAAPSHFTGIIGGPPCQDFSAANRRARPQRGLQILSHFARVVIEAQPDWFLLENVPRCPTVNVPGMVTQRIDLTGHDVGMRQWRLRHFQFAAIDGAQLYVPRSRSVTHHIPAACMATATSHTRTRWSTFCERQGVIPALSLPPFTRRAKYQAVGNGVPLPMARLLAWAITRRGESHPPLCACRCGRAVAGRAITATPGCRKRLERQKSASQDARHCAISDASDRPPLAICA
jgi:DNA (cytosine-5)-methyltransferase 1